MAINNPVIADADIIQDTAVAIQEKDHGGKMEFPDFPSRIRALPTNLIPKTITENGIYNATNDNADGYDVVTVNVPQGPYEVMNDYIEGTLTRLRLNNVPSRRLKYIQPGGSNSSIADQTIQRIELPNNTNTLEVWQFGNMRNLLFFDGGYTPKFDNVCLYGCNSLMWIVVRKRDSIPPLFAWDAISLRAAGRIAVAPELIEDYKNGTNWSHWAGRFRNLYFANSNDELEELLLDDTIPNESMIVCDYNETYYVKGEGIV